MKKKSNNTAAALIFAVLLLYCLYGSIGLIRSFMYIAPVSLLCNLIGRILCIIPLVILMINAFKGKSNQKTKKAFMVMYVLGSVLPWLPNLMYIGVGAAMGLLRTAICIAVFYAALFKLMGNAEESTASNMSEADAERISYYKELLDSGVITKEEYEQMKKNMEQRSL